MNTTSAPSFPCFRQDIHSSLVVYFTTPTTGVSVQEGAGIPAGEIRHDWHLATEWRPVVGEFRLA